MNERINYEKQCMFCKWADNTQAQCFDGHIQNIAGCTSFEPNNSKPAAEDTVDKEEKDHKSITDLLDDAKTKMCNEYCRYPFMPIPEGKDGDWLDMDPDSPCMNCPLDML